MNLSDAIAADRAGNVVSAATLYEKILATSGLPLRALLDLAVLYWQSTDIGLAAAKRLSHEFFDTAGRRFPQLLDEASKRFPESTEVRFWKQYIAWADLGEEFNSDDCRQLLREDPSVLTPAVHLFSISGGREAKTEAQELLRQCREDGTTRARYIASVLEAAIERTAHQR